MPIQFPALCQIVEEPKINIVNKVHSLDFFTHTSNTQTAFSYIKTQENSIILKSVSQLEYLTLPETY